MNSTRKKKYLIIGFCLFITAGFLYVTTDTRKHVVNTISNVSIDDKKAMPIREIASVVTKNDIVSEGTIEGLVAVSDTIVIGSFESLDYVTTNMIKEANHTNEQSSDYEEGRVYRFVVKEALKGNPELTIAVGQSYFERKKLVEDNAVIENYIVVKPATKQQISTFDVLQPAFIQPELNKEYILFLNKSFDFYCSASRAFAITFENDQAQFLTNTESAKKLSKQVFKKKNGTEVTFMTDYEPILKDEISGLTKDEILSSVQNALGQ